MTHPKEVAGDFTGCSYGIDGEDGILVDPRFNEDMEAGAEATGVDLRDTTFIWRQVRWVGEDEPDYDEETYAWEFCRPDQGTRVGFVSLEGEDGTEVIDGWAEQHELRFDRG